MIFKNNFLIILSSEFFTSTVRYKTNFSISNMIIRKMFTWFIFTNSSLYLPFYNWLGNSICFFFGISFLIHVKMNYSIIYKIWIKLFFKQSFSPISTPKSWFVMVFTGTFSFFAWFLDLKYHLFWLCSYIISNSLESLFVIVYFFTIF